MMTKPPMILYDRFGKYLRTILTRFKEFELIFLIITTTCSWNSLKKAYKHISIMIIIFTKRYEFIRMSTLIFRDPMNS